MTNKYSRLVAQKFPNGFFCNRCGGRVDALVTCSMRTNPTGRETAFQVCDKCSKEVHRGEGR